MPFRGNLHRKRQKEYTAFFPPYIHDIHFAPAGQADTSPLILSVPVSDEPFPGEMLRFALLRKQLSDACARYNDTKDQQENSEDKLQCGSDGKTACRKRF